MGKDSFGSGRSNNSATTDLHAGLKNRAAKFPDKSMGCGSKSVDSDTTRSSTASTPRSLEGREIGGRTGGVNG